MKEELSRLEQQVSGNNETQKIEEYQETSEERIVVHLEYSFDKFKKEVQEETNMPYLDLELLKKAWEKIPKGKFQKICLEVTNELWGQHQYEARKEYEKLVRKKQKEMISTHGIYEDPE